MSPKLPTICDNRNSQTVLNAEGKLDQWQYFGDFKEAGN
jgi:hypothetical protein